MKSIMGNDGGNLGEWLGIPHEIPTGKGFPSRDVEFTCEGCGRRHVEHRWAFLPGSGALSYFTLPGERRCREWPHSPQQT